ncbi:sulfurtransferase [Herbaspirillum rubrisubalbicans]|uniref:Sulfurtransferase n=1 Tax=Herbaspirillum rubrisubalbicans TaxID=80842 RepID=A0ABX9BYK2_9BURK|nr:rhodanese-like domain-containing protein [Herbaspirillum rubrisubalbicans]RAM62846.1 sulfurtransferase [Herbaspirillum rubrisubalbicans]RAN49266.1 sulfurtransferase [Herbaspirillum rubrisubalbicans]
MADTISPATLRHWLADGAELALLDVREAGQFGEGHLFFAVPLPYSRLELDAPRLVPRQDVRLVLVDDGDGVAILAARRLEALGYRQVLVLDGGVQAWQAAGHTLFKGVNVPSKTFGELVEHAYATPHISASELDQWRRAGKRFVLLDGRTLEEHHKMTIPGSVACPNGELAYRIGTLVPDADVPVVINCAGRTRSILGAQTLRNLGLANPVLALENGTQGWYLAGLTLEHGSKTRYPDQPPQDLEAARAAAERLRQHFAIPQLDAVQAQAWVDDPRRTTYVLDIRSAEEFLSGTLAGAVHAPGGQLIQATDQYVGVRRSRLILLDHEQIRAPVVASWLHQLGFEVAVLAQGIATPLQLPLEQASQTHTASIAQADVQAATRQVKQRQALLLDVRSSESYLKEHALTSQWLIRPRIGSWIKAQPSLPEQVFLVADSAAAAALVAHDLRQAGVKELAWIGGLAPLQQVGWPTITDPASLGSSERIDYLFFVHDRHAGNADAARQYLAWETALVAQCSQDELGAFRLDSLPR